jgi:hypothetical protein
MSLIAKCISEARNRSDCEILEKENPVIDHNYIGLNGEADEFYQMVGGIVYGKQVYDGRSVWLWRTLKPSEVLPLVECNNPYGLTVGEIGSAAEFLHIIAKSMGGGIDVAFMLGGPLNGYSFIVEHDTLVWGGI